MVRRAHVTIAEIAKRAGVHPSTVSRALTPAPGTRLSNATTERIVAIAAELGYQPDQAAAALRTGRSGALGVIVPRLTDYVLARIYEGIDEAAQRAGYQTVVTNSNDDAALRLTKLDELLARRIEGVIVGDARLDGDDLAQTLDRKFIPHVLVNRRLRGHLSVTTDDVLGGKLAARHLLDLGITKPAVLAGPSYVSTCVERTHGFVGRFLSSGVDVDDDCVVESAPDAEGGYVAAGQLLDTHPEIEAIFAINDFAAIGAMGAAREHGRTPGRDIAVIGYNDIPLARHLPVPLTSVTSPMLQMGIEGANRLCQLLAGEHVESVRLPPTLSVRESTEGLRHPNESPVQQFG
ncbi:LacI family DNA-binding transcriptional regulator [Rhodococcus sp. T2V]|uniref:LacI family DNA-binding transcriptional regulator n=1 Tax=Rhodococcus sp. T2V TaxID=3034164 RepID=UPI0023E27623|nr:LacI family DNA-binding transcriptional regulator [Rhodococcus sp. T2V]MDF3308140.1 LacI family DNA-binding transcriptional regulator [Rhodococcus sp. T2V]